MSEPSYELGEEDPNPPPPPQGQDIEEIQHQFEQQQSMITQLKGALQSSKQELANKEKEIEECAATLSGIKSRAKASKRSLSGAAKRTSNVGEAKEKEQPGSASTSIAAEGPVQEGTIDTGGGRKDIKKSGKNTEKSRLLRKKLEENRMKFEQRGKEMSENKKGIEEMVENLRMQLEERDQVIQTLQKGLESKPGVPVLLTQDFVEGVQMSPESNVDEQIDKREMYAQIVYKDNKIVELNNRVMELELNVLDLQENLKEKDAVIDARTRAITLMSEDMSRKSKTTLDTLDDTREQMRLMQNNFITLEARMKDEQEHLKKQLEEKDRKLKYVEESHKKLESIRFELTTNIAELQEKVVHLQSMNSALQRQVDETSKQRESRGEKQDRVEELLRALEESNRQMLKVKAQHKNKVKSLTKQIDSLKKVSESSDEILQLQQRVAELEEDKATELSWKQRIQELEDKVKQQNQDLDAHVHALSQVEGEKLNFIEDLHAERLQVSALNRELNVLQSRITEIENMKVTAEMKAVELEELVDILSHEKTDLQRENETLTNDRTEYKQLLDTLQQEKAELLEEITTLQTLLKESNPGDTDSNRSEFQMVSSNNSDEEKWKRLPTPEETSTEEKHVKDSSNVELYVKLLESELEDARKVISEEKDTILDLKLKLEAKEEEIEMHLEVISKLEQLGREVSSQQEDVSDVNKISEILKELNDMTGDLEEWKKRCSEVEDRLKSLEEEKVSLEEKLEEVTNENSVLSSQVSLQKQVSEDLVANLRERNKVISEKDEVIKELENKMAGTQKEMELPDNPDSESRTSSDESAQYEIISLKEQLENLRKICEDYKNEISAKDADLLQIKMELLEKDDGFMQKSGADENSVRMQDELQEKEVLIEQLRKECQELRHDLEKLNIDIQKRTQFVEALPENSDKIPKLELLLIEKDGLLSEKNDELEKVNQKLKNVTDKVKKLAVNLKAKAVVIQNLEEKEKRFMEHIQEKEELVSNLYGGRENAYAEIESLKLQCEEKDKTITTLSEKIESNLQFQDSIIGQLVAQNKDLVTANENLKVAVDNLTVEKNNADENRCHLTNQVLVLEKEISNLKDDLHNKIEEINFYNEECKNLLPLEEENKLLEENKAQNEKKNQELIAEIMKKEDELVELSLKLDEFSKTMEIKNENIEMSSVRYKELEQIIVTKDMQVTALEDRLSNLQNSWSALEAKLQEREAVIESLEQDLAKSHSHQQHLEEGLSFIEERRRSIENKFAALGEQLQESDRIKEEAEEHEGELAHRLAALASSEEMLRKRLETLNENKVELSQKISELTLENENLQRNVVNADNNFKISNKEVERLSSCENAYHQSLETIEKLEADLRKRTVEFERTYKEKEQQSSQYVENLELDMKNLSKQLEVMETEKRSLMEHCENLNDIKMNLEDDIETLQDKVESYHSKILELESKNKEKELEFNSEIGGKREEIMKLNKKIQQLEVDLGKWVAIPGTTNTVSIQTQETLDNSESIQQLKLELENITKLLTQRETELQSYQNRLLQLQFSKEGDRSMPDKEDHLVQKRQLERSIVELQEKLNLKESQLEELRVLLESANSEMGNTQLQLANSCKKIEEMSFEMCNLHDVVRSKDNQLQGQMEQISHITNSDKLSQHLESINADYQAQLSVLQQQNSQLHQELVREKAKSMVSEIVSSAQIHVHEHRNLQEAKVPSFEENRVHFNENIYCIPSKSDVDLQTSVQEQMHMEIIPKSHVQIISSNVESAILNSSEADLTIRQTTEEIFSGAQSSETNTRQELVEKLGDLRAELDIVKSEKAHALMKVKELELEVNRLLDVEKQLNDVHGRLEMFVASQGSADLGSEQFSKESSVDSECAGERKGYTVDVQNEEKQQFTCVKIESEMVHRDSHGQQIPVSEQVDLTEPSWAGETLDEEGWGWGEEEARLEEEHMERQKAALDSNPVSNELQQHVLELEKKIELIEEEKNKIADELKASQVRSGKMLKKLKDLKLKNENLMRENQEFALKKSNEFGSLDLAIEEELKIRIDSLEKELKECKGERDAVNMEKEGLQRRIETLTATNERLAEREQHGLDIDFWQNKNKELNNQVESLQWRIEELMEERETDNSSKALNLQEFQEQIAALAADNEQLQNMLEEQRNLRVAAEAALRELQQFTSLKETNLLQETEENYVTLRENYDMLCKEMVTLRAHTAHDSLIAENAVLRENYDMLSRELEQLHSSSNNDIIAAEYSSMRGNYEAMCNELEELRLRVDVSNTLQANYESLQIAHDKIINEMNHMQKEYCNITEKYEMIVKEKSQMQDEFSEKSKSIQENCELMLNQLEREKAELVMKYDKVSSEFALVSDDLQHLKDEVEKYKNIIATLIQEQERLNEINNALNNKYATELNELQQLRDEVERYKIVVASMTQEQESLKEVNYSLNEKYEKLSSNSVPSSEKFDEPKANITFLEETFAPIELFSKIDQETCTDMIEKSSVETQVRDAGDDSNLEKQIRECKSQILNLEETKQQKINELDVLRAMFSSEQEEWAKIEQNLSKKVEELEGELQMIKEAAKRESEVRESLMLKEHELSNVRSHLSYMEEVLTKTQEKVEDLEAQLVQKEEEFQNVNQNSESQENIIQQIISSKEQELNKLHKTLVLKQDEQEKLLLNKDKDIENLKLQIADRENEIENLIIVKDQDIQNLKRQMSEIEENAQAIVEKKDTNIQMLQAQLAQNNSEIQNLSQTLKEKELQVIELQEVLEAREDEIREAVIQIRDRNIEIQVLKQSSSVAVERISSSPLVEINTQTSLDSQTESSQQNELDLALYMLHQRDVRCEELTLELMQLLEERDTLQLRLSTALRINEELRNKISKTSNTSTPLRVIASQRGVETSSSTSDLQNTSEKVIAPIDPEPVTKASPEESKEDLKILADKLSQLHSVDYRRDVTLQEEREQRHSEQVMLLQSRGPGVLVESNYTLSRDVQSPSTVLLNWIWGRSTPKVLHL